MSDKKPNIQPKISDEIAPQGGCKPGLILNENVSDFVSVGGQGGSASSASASASSSATAGVSLSGSGSCTTCTISIRK